MTEVCGKKFYKESMKHTMDDAFRAVPRDNFLPPDLADHSAMDDLLPIGHGQTNSQPTTVALMLDWLEVEPGSKVLDVGSGSGWTSALLAHLVGDQGRVDAVEIVPELVDLGRDNVEKLGFQNVLFHQAGSVLGLPHGAPYDRILVSAEAKELPKVLIEQLVPGGRMVVPVKGSIVVVDKEPNGSLTKLEHPGFVFVPLIN